MLLIDKISKLLAIIARSGVVNILNGKYEIGDPKETLS
jgi:hypothetical protein